MRAWNVRVRLGGQGGELGETWPQMSQACAPVAAIRAGARLLVRAMHVPARSPSRATLGWEMLGAPPRLLGRQVPSDRRGPVRRSTRGQPAGTAQYPGPRCNSSELPCHCIEVTFFPETQSAEQHEGQHGLRANASGTIPCLSTCS